MTATPRPDNPAGPEGSGKVEQVFDDWFHAQGLASERVPFDGRSDYVGFTDRGIPAGGVFAGAEDVEDAASRKRSTAAPRARGSTRATTSSATT